MLERLVAQTKAYFRSYTLTDLAYVAAAFVATAPAWIVRYPPIQDLPFHLATIRVVHNFHSAGYHFDENFVLTLGRTQYVLYYLVGSFLAYFVGVIGANVLLMCGYLGGTVLALRSLLRALGKDERLCLLAVPLLYNVMFLFGLLPFLLGIPLMFLALATSVRWFEEPTRARAILLGVLAVCLFYSHIFPFGIFGLGFALMFPWKEPRRWLRAGAPVVPALLVFAWWTFFTEAGKLTRGTLTDRTSQDQAAPLNQAVPAVYNWLLDIFKDQSDDVVLIGFVLCVLFLTAMAHGEATTDESRPVARMYGLLPIVCVLLYFTTGEGHGYIWLISQRFPILFFLTVIPLLRMPRGGLAATLATTAMATLALYSTVNVCKHFITFQREEVGDIDGAIDEMEPGKKVAALIFDKGSKTTNWTPFLHFGSYYQLNKGGVIEFTYAGYAHWPFDFKPGKFPPPGGPARLRWEWTPEQVGIRELFPYYDYVLVRGSGFNPPPGTFHQKWHGDRWTVFERDQAAAP
jgi:hypothetical protein